MSATRVVRLLLPLTLCLVGWLAMATPALGGSTSYVATHGNSMEPAFHTGDLAVVRAADHYEVGDVVAYHSDLLNTTVMHRVVAIDDGHHTFQGDNNSWRDREQPTQDELIGKLVLRIPQGGVWLDRLTSPTLVGLLAFGLLAGGATAARTRRTRRKSAMSQHAQRTRPSLTFGTLPPTLSTAAALAALLGLLGAGLAAFAWTESMTRTATDERSSDQQVTFSYTAQVPRSAAYDGTTVRSPDPVFRSLADSVVVSFSYQGGPGSVSVVAELSTSNGWHSTLPLTQPTRFDGDSHEGTVSLDLAAFERRAQAAADVIGVPADQVTVTVRARFDTHAGATFRADLPLTLSTTQLALGDASALTVTDAGTVRRTITAPRMLGMLGHEIPVATARTVSAALLALAVLVAALVAALARIGAPGSEGAAIRRRHANILVRVEPMPTPTGRPVIDVSEFATLVKLAERYGLLVLHWSRTNVETFVVQDESTTYRYRAAAESSNDGDTHERSDPARDAVDPDPDPAESVRVRP
jgi:signal peptidase I